MIRLTRINGTEILMNERFIEIVEETPDTVITLMNGHRYLVKETIDEILERSARQDTSMPDTPLNRDQHNGGENI